MVADHHRQALPLFGLPLRRKSLCRKKRRPATACY
ncbi:Protein of unknown function [Pyronema omphalodes CBS 100304]|uniref:Uncharacterized protein n=1 Tax=Pyronema omphalodes (strain CBS 100304) TaxID=1076935 RepID=U4LUE2_PYROM|nr:Protein of unknown function [Pyronema omphalodes CBS 100304]